MGAFKCFIIFLLGCATLTVADDAFCPPATIGSSCSCGRDTTSGPLGTITFTKVVCRNINKLSTLLSEIQNFRGYKIDVLFLMNLELPYLPAGLFLNTSVKKLYIKDSVLGNLYSTTDYDPSPFAGLEDSLEKLAVHATKLPSNWTLTNLKGFKHLKEVDIFDSRLDFVGHWFADIGEGSLESIRVAFSRVYRIHPQAFPELTNLKEVNFAGNFLPYMVRTMFRNPATQLRTINLSENKLFTLPEDMFDNMPALERVDLSHNDFKTFQNMPAYNSLKFFYISHNPFDCGCHLLPLMQLPLYEASNMFSDLRDVKCKLAEDKKMIYVRDMSSKVQCP